MKRDTASLGRRRRKRVGKDMLGREGGLDVRGVQGKGENGDGEGGKDRREGERKYEG